MEFNVLMTVVNSVSKTTHFISAHTIVSIKIEESGLDLFYFSFHFYFLFFIYFYIFYF